MPAAPKRSPLPRMTAAEFLDWTEEQPDRPRYELLDGEVIAMAPETGGHARSKFHIARRLAEAVERSRLPCEVFVDSVGVQPDGRHVYIPDVVLRCGAPLPDDDRIVDDPVVAIEVTSPSTRRVDEAIKSVGYFAIPSMRHYLIVVPGARQIVHHARGDDGVVIMQFRGAEVFRLDPPGVVLDGVFPTEE